GRDGERRRAVARNYSRAECRRADRGGQAGQGQGDVTGEAVRPGDGDGVRGGAAGRRGDRRRRRGQGVVRRGGQPLGGGQHVQAPGAEVRIRAARAEVDGAALQGDGLLVGGQTGQCVEQQGKSTRDVRRRHRRARLVGVAAVEVAGVHVDGRRGD